MKGEKRVLTIDDDSEIQELLKMQLEGAGYEVIQAFNGIDGLKLARSEGPDIIILDLMLPDIIGYKICRRLKSDSKYKNIPIIMLTGMSDKKDKLMGFESEADDYETKPFTANSILEKIKKLLSKKEEEK